MPSKYISIIMCSEPHATRHISVHRLKSEARSKLDKLVKGQLAAQLARGRVMHAVECGSVKYPRIKVMLDDVLITEWSIHHVHYTY